MTLAQNDFFRDVRFFAYIDHRIRLPLHRECHQGISYRNTEADQNLKQNSCPIKLVLKSNASHAHDGYSFHGALSENLGLSGGGEKSFGTRETNE
jgi:hypothetical protein